MSVDIDGKTQTGTYSVTTQPSQRGYIGLAIKSSSTHPVTRWLYQAREGDTLKITRG